MSEKKPTPWTPKPSGMICPVCGTRTYSSGGIHPQCAVQQADAPRVEQLREDRKREEKEEKTEKRSSWTKKKCPKCGIESHVRRKSCQCGHVFS